MYGTATFYYQTVDGPPMDDQFSIESEQSPAEVAETLRSLAAQFETGERLRIAEGEHAAVAELADTLSLEMELERGSGEAEFELEVEWADPSEEGTETEDGAETVDDLTLDPEESAETEPDDAGPGTDGSLATFQLFEDRAGEWRWRLRHRNGNVIASSGEGYTSKQNAKKGLQSVVRNAPDADIVEVDSPD